MIAYHNDPSLKARFVQELVVHQVHDQIIQGTYGEYSGGLFRGCAVGCSLHSLGYADTTNHGAYEEAIGVPQILAQLQDRIFEGLPASEAPAFVVAFGEAIPVGADLSGVWDRFALRLLTDPEHGAVAYARTDRTRQAIADVAARYERQIGGDSIPASEWRMVRSAAAAAYAAAAAAAYAADAAAAAAAAAAAYAAYAAYAAAAAAAAYAAYAAKRAANAYATADAARADHFRWQRDVLLELLAEAPVLDQAV